jgi:hypothetical protein
MRKWFAIVLILLLLSACSPDDWANRLPYAGPVEKGIGKGDFLPGTPIQYVERTTDGARVSIEGKQAVKKLGDSLDWKADVRSGVNVDQTYRVALIAEDTLHVAGTARIIIWNAIPEPGPANTEAPMHFKLPVGYHVEKGQTIPGTTLTFVGKTEQGAELGNAEGYPYRQAGDSITWEGKLREGVWIELDLRTALITAEVLDVVGTADLWIQP